MPRMIVNYPDGMAEEHALALVLGVINIGRVSGPKERPQFCYASVTEKWATYATMTKAGTDSFDIRPRHITE